jgi:hypothetical protein
MTSVRHRDVTCAKELSAQNGATIVIRGECEREFGETEVDWVPRAVVTVTAPVTEEGKSIQRSVQVIPPATDWEPLSDGYGKLDHALDRLSRRKPAFERDLFFEVGGWLRMGVWQRADGSSGEYVELSDGRNRLRVELKDAGDLSWIESALRQAWSARP